MSAEGGRAILVLDDDQNFLGSMRRLLISSDYKDVVALDKSEELLDILDKREFSVLLLDWIMPELGGEALLPVVLERFPDMPVIIMTGVDEIQNIVGCIKQGAFDYLIKTTDPNRILSSIDKACQFSEMLRQNRRLKGYLLGDTLLEPEIFSGIITINPRMLSTFKLIETMSASNSPVMITGETGVGKELFARAIHRTSGVSGDFVTLNVAGLDDQMFADTFFGHKKGAFTGASEAREGMISKARGGTLFLDEIGDLGSDSQVKLLRLLQEAEYYRLGSDTLMKSNARIITASNVNFSDVVSQGLFRRDLYHRLRSHHIHIPPLRERPEDIPLLIDHYLQNSAVSMGRGIPSISKEARDALTAYQFPGNVRELINIVHNAVACNSKGVLSLSDFPEIGSSTPLDVSNLKIYQDKQFRLQAVFPKFPSLESVERLLIDEAVQLSSGNKSIAADLLGVARSTLHRKLAEMEIVEQHTSSNR